jgi:hypothetical protein
MNASMKKGSHDILTRRPKPTTSELTWRSRGATNSRGDVDALGGKEGMRMGDLCRTCRGKHAADLAACGQPSLRTKVIGIVSVSSAPFENPQRR